MPLLGQEPAPYQITLCAPPPQRLYFIHLFHSPLTTHPTQGHKEAGASPSHRVREATPCRGYQTYFKLKLYLKYKEIWFFLYLLKGQPQ